eukprot:TRINITY_DN43989_c0_g1_i1.p1 TRINITY_DN43989_c0_g1~~TRINITY_DN43989_c0_g1_i1.p1  ORF type:complete len:605 (-),score=27.60 TRINITY_DN43989_c0_g1_i1:271-2085(-)
MDSGACALRMLGAAIMTGIAQASLMKAMTEGVALYWIATGLSVAAVVSITASVLRAASIVFGSPGIPVGMNMIALFVVAIMVACCGGSVVAYTNANDALLETVLMGVVLVASGTGVFLACNLRGIALLPIVLYTSLCCDPDYIAIMNPGRPSWVIYGNMIANVGMVVLAGAGGCTTYLQDQRLCYAIAFYFSSVGTIVVSPDFGSGCCCVVVGAIIGYGTILLGRRARVLPPALQRCKFSSLGHLRKMLASGQQIRRCQEMPEDAFADVGKAAILIITSHRWLDRFTCDVLDASGNAVRLNSMLRRLSISFPETMVSAFHLGLFMGLRSMWKALVHGGSDVLLFFDFMGLPQIGLTADGEQIARTAEETTLFVEALPSMGAFYGMYPVLVIPEVTAEVHPYFTSGWCSSEFYTAMLAKQLDQYSAEAISDFNEYRRSSDLCLTQSVLDSICSGSLSETDVVEFNTLFSQDLQRKRLFNEADREIIGGIVEGFLLRRQLTDAINRQDVADVKRHLEHMEEKGLRAILHQAVDETVDTFLHLAVRLASTDIVQLLLQAGADPTLRNRYGDTPTLWYMWPRMSAGARTCRSWQGDANNRYQTLLTAP